MSRDRHGVIMSGLLYSCTRLVLQQKKQKPRSESVGEGFSKAVFTPVPVRVPVPFHSFAHVRVCVHTSKNVPDPFRARASDALTLVSERVRLSYHAFRSDVKIVKNESGR